MNLNRFQPGHAGDPVPNQFTLYEDDGATLAYGQDTRPIYQTCSTVTSRQQTGNGVKVVIDQAVGNYPDASFATADSGWFNVGRNLVLIKSGAGGVETPKRSTFTGSKPRLSKCSRSFINAATYNLTKFRAISNQLKER